MKWRQPTSTTTTTSCPRVLLREEAVTSKGGKQYEKAHVKHEDVIVAALNQDTVSPDTRWTASCEPSIDAKDQQQREQ
jgi:hypothetical protein